jgi:hypothetical protein
MLKLQWLQEEHNCCLNDTLCIYAAIDGSISTLRWLKQQGCAFATQCCYNAAQHNQLSSLQYLHSEGCEWDSTVLDVSADKLELFQWAAEHDYPGEAHTVCSEVAKRGSVPVLIYLQQKGLITAENLTHLMNVAGAYNRLAAVKWLRQQGAEWPDVLLYINEVWSCSTLEYARDEGCISLLTPPPAAED